MNSGTLARFARRASVTALLALAAVAPRAQAACPYFGMDTTTTYGVNSSPSIIELPQSLPVWSAFAIRPQGGDDWDVALYQNGAPDPTCVSTLLASSSAGGTATDFVIGDYAHDPAGTYYADCTHFSGSNQGLVRWRQSQQILTVNGAPVSRTWGVTDVIETWNVSLVAGTTYSINFGIAGGLDAKVLVFRNPGGGTYWTGRSGAALSATTNTSYAAPATGNYAIVVVSDNGGNGTFSLSIGTCVTPTALAAGTITHTDLGESYHQFNQVDSYWTAVGVRSTTSDYDITVGGNTLGSFPACVGDIKASSTGVGLVDFVVGDFNYNTIGTYYVHNHDFSGPGGADVEWDSGADLLTPDAAPISRSSGPGNVLEVWDVFLAAGQTYNFAFNPTSSDAHMLLFRNPVAGTYWAGRGAAQFDVTGCQTYVAPATGYYGVVVTNETGNPLTYTLGVSKAPCVCSTPLADLTPTNTPNPDGYFNFTDVVQYWAVVGTRGVTNADDYDLTVASQATGNPAPTCFGTPVAASSYGAGLADIGVIDFNQSPNGTYYAESHHFSGGAPNGLIEWDETHGLLTQNGPYQNVPMGSSEIAHAWDAYLTAGQTYQIEFYPTDPTIKLMVFENPGGAYYATRGGAALLTSASTSYTPAVSGYHGFIVVNDQAVNGSYVLRFGQCASPVALTSGTGTTAFDGYDMYSYAQPASQWAAVGVRSTTADWDIQTSATTSSPFPNCIGGSLATSTSGNLNYVDFVTGDFFHNAAGTYYALAHQYTNGGAVPSSVEWSAGNGDVLVNDNNVVGHTSDGADFLQSWSVFMAAGTQYTFTFNHTGAANLHLLLFQNAGGAGYWTGRFSAVADLTPGGGPFNYVAPTTGEYGIVVANDDGGSDSYTFQVQACFAPTALSSGVSTTDLPVGFHSFNQGVTYWTAVGVRGASDWDIDVNANPGGGGPGICQSGMLANSTLGGTVTDFVVGDFNPGANTTGTYYVRSHRFAGTSPGTVEWDSGADAITVGAAPIHRTTDATDVLECWDVFLNAGQTYGVYFAHYGAANTHVFLFRNPGGPYWAGRGAAVYTNSILGNYTAPASGWYGVVVANDNGAVGDYYLGITSGALAAPIAGAPTVTELRTVLPNPARAAMSIEYSLSQRAPVHVQMIDLSGRVVADVENTTHEPGVWHAGWNGRTASGAKAAPGVYMVRLEVDGHAIGQRKVTVLE